MNPFVLLPGLIGTNLVGKNIEYTPVGLVFDELFVKFIERIREGVAGDEWSGEINLRSKGIIVFCRIAPTVFEDGRGEYPSFLKILQGENRESGRCWRVKRLLVHS